MGIFGHKEQKAEVKVRLAPEPKREPPIESPFVRLAREGKLPVKDYTHG